MQTVPLWVEGQRKEGGREGVRWSARQAGRCGQVKTLGQSTVWVLMHATAQTVVAFC